MQSLQIFKDGAWNVRTCACEGMTYYCAKDVAEALGYRNSRQAVICNVLEEDCAKLQDIHKSCEFKRNAGHTTYLTPNGVKRLVMRSQMPDALKLAEALGITCDTKYIRKEPEIVRHLVDFLSEMNIATNFQKTVGRHRVDLYLPDYKLAIEIDEHNHRDRDPHEERCREEYIRRDLGCEFMRINPDASDFNIFKLCAQIANRIITMHTHH